MESKVVEDSIKLVSTSIFFLKIVDSFYYFKTGLLITKNG